MNEEYITLISKKEFEDIRCGDQVKCMYHKKVMCSPGLIDGGYGDDLTCGCPFDMLVIIMKNEERELLERSFESQRD